MPPVEGKFESQFIDEGKNVRIKKGGTEGFILGAGYYAAVSAETDTDPANVLIHEEWRNDSVIVTIGEDGEGRRLQPRAHEQVILEEGVPVTITGQGRKLTLKAVK